MNFVYTERSSLLEGGARTLLLVSIAEGNGAERALKEGFREVPMTSIGSEFRVPFNNDVKYIYSIKQKGFKLHLAEAVRSILWFERTTDVAMGRPKTPAYWLRGTRVLPLRIDTGEFVTDVVDGSFVSNPFFYWRNGQDGHVSLLNEHVLDEYNAWMKFVERTDDSHYGPIGRSQFALPSYGPVHPWTRVYHRPPEGPRRDFILGAPGSFGGAESSYSRVTGTVPFFLLSSEQIPFFLVKE